MGCEDRVSTDRMCVGCDCVSLDGMCDKSADLGRSGREHGRGRRRGKSVQAPQGRSDPVFNVLGAAGSPRAFQPW